MTGSAVRAAADGEPTYMPDIDNLEVRPACERDLPGLVNGDKSHRGILWERLRRRAAGGGELLVALVDSTPVGHVYVWLEAADEPELRERLPGVPLLMNLWVHRDWRRRGIGSLLTREAERWLYDRGHRRVALGVSPDNTDATRLYLGLDYEPWEYEDIKTIKTHWTEFLDDGQEVIIWETCAILEKALRPPA